MEKDWYKGLELLHDMSCQPEFHLSGVMCSLTNEDKLYLVKKLREETGWGMMDCRRALRESNWNMDDAKSWLIQFRKKPGIMFD